MEENILSYFNFKSSNAKFYWISYYIFDNDTIERGLLVITNR